MTCIALTDKCPGSCAFHLFPPPSTTTMTGYREREREGGGERERELMMILTTHCIYSLCHSNEHHFQLNLHY
jgi:hypothetical protein